MKPPITYYGGKQLMAATINHIIEQQPHTCYNEPFFGGGAVFFHKKPSKIEIINDKNSFIVNFYRACVLQFDALKQMIEATPYSHEMHAKARAIFRQPEGHSELAQAWAVWVLSRMSFRRKFGNIYAFSKLESTCAKVMRNKKDAFTLAYKERLDNAQIDNRCALKVIAGADADTTLHYIDPPYYNSNMGHYGGYTEKDFADLLNLLATIKGKFILSSYPSDGLHRAIAANGWHSVEIEKTLFASDKAIKPKKIEVITTNFPFVFRK